MRVANSWEERKRHSAMYDWGVILLVYVYLLAPCRGLEDAVDCSTHTIATYIPVKNFHGEAVEKYQYSGSFTKLPAYWYFSTQSWRLKKNRLTDQMREKKTRDQTPGGRIPKDLKKNNNNQPKWGGWGYWQKDRLLGEGVWSLGTTESRMWWRRSVDDVFSFLCVSWKWGWWGTDSKKLECVRLACRGRLFVHW